VKFLLTFISFFFLELLLCQTRTPQLGELIKRVDSLTNLIQSERIDNQLRILDLKKLLSEKQAQLDLIKQKYNIQNDETNLTPSQLNNNTESITIGKQIWMKENLNVSFFRNGDPIPEARSNEEWIAAGKQGKPVWCSYDNNPKNDEKYGKLYNWFAITDTRGLAPSGWKIPEFEDLNVIDSYLWSDVGSKLKSNIGWNSWNVEERCKSCIGWTDDHRKSKKCISCNNMGVRISKTNSGNGNNTSGFSAMPGGFRNANGNFEKIGQESLFWSSSEQYSLYGRYRMLTNMDNELLMNYTTKDFGMSVRCLKN